MASEVLTKSRVLSDLLKHLDAEIYCLESYKLTNPHSDAVTFPVFTPCSVNEGTKVATPVVSASIGNAEALLLEEHRLEAGDDSIVYLTFLRRGPAVVNKSELAFDDYAGDAYVAADFETELATWSPPVICRSEPTEQERAGVSDV